MEFGEIRKFASGATRNLADGKLAYEAFDHPAVDQRYAEYMDTHRLQKNGEVRDGDNWQRGIPPESYIDSMVRHQHDVRMLWRGCDSAEGADLETALCAVLFNAKGLLYELLLQRKAYGIERLAKPHSQPEASLSYTPGDTIEGVQVHRLDTGGLYPDYQDPAEAYKYIRELFTPVPFTPFGKATRPIGDDAIKDNIVLGEN